MPGKNGGDLLWAEVGSFPVCSDTPPWQPLANALALGPTGDIAVGLGCHVITSGGFAGNVNTVAYQRYNGSGVLLVSGDYEAAPNNGVSTNIQWSTFSMDPNGDLVTGVSGCEGAGGSGPPWTCTVCASFEVQPAQGGASSQGNIACGSDVILHAGGYCCGPLIDQAITATGQLGAAPAVPAGIPDGAGGTYVLGSLAATLDLGCGPMTPTGSSNGYVAHLGPTSACIFSHVLPAVPAAVADTQGVVLSASSTTSLDLGCGALAAAAGGSTFITRLDPSGACVFGKSLPASGLAVALDPAGSAVVSGLVGAAPFNFGGGSLAPLGSQDFVLGELDASGNYLWGKRFGGTGITFVGPWVTVAAAGDVYLRTGWIGAVDLGGGAITAASNDTVVARYAPSGTYVWGRDFPIAGKYVAGVDGCGSLVVTSSDPTFDPGQGTLLPQPPYTGSSVPSDAIVKYAP